MDGDTIIVESKTTADEGQIVVALLEDYSATLKVYSRDKKNKKFVLKPMNPKYEPIVTDKLYIQGILLGVIRGY
jgi:repressor LexA